MSIKKRSYKKRMSESEIFNHLAGKTGMNRSEVKEVFDELDILVSRELKSGNEFVIPVLGKLVKTQRKARQGRNPATGEPIQIPYKPRRRFPAGKIIKRNIGGDPYTDPD